MCGITGAISLNEKSLPIERLKPMVDTISHRGPDDAGYLIWQSGVRHKRGLSFGKSFTDRKFSHISPLLPVWDNTSGQNVLNEYNWDVFMGHRRLSIIDLSSRGHQPMSDISEKVWIVFNGEIYNFKSIRKELEAIGYTFNSHSDTEVLIYAYEAWGEDFVEKLNGMFAFALYDCNKKTMLFCRDRYGVKPLYYSFNDDYLVFGSEIKSILEFIPNSPEVDLAALNEYFSFQNILSDRTLFDGVKLLPPGTKMVLDLETGKVTKKQYWDFDFSNEKKLTEIKAEDDIYKLLKSSVHEQIVSDVPISSYLSGGMDSGTITALLAKEFGRINTFTTGFDLSEAASHEKSFDERETAEHMSNVFQTEHYECVLHSGDMENVMPHLIWHLEDLRVGQCYPNYYTSRLASKFGKVVMSGAGGDELFGGYPWRYAAAIGKSEEEYASNYYHYWQRLVSNKDKEKLFNEETKNKLKKMNLDEGTPFKDYTLNVFKNVFPNNMKCSTREDQVNNSLYFECKTFLHGLLLVEDKISMAHSLETRVPYLNNDLVDYAMSVPVSMKVNGLDHLEMFDENIPKKKRLAQQRTASGKAILRSAMSRILPESVHKAKKQGFSAPDESWFRGRSEEYIRKELLSSDARIYEYLSHDFVKEVIEEHISEKKNKRLLIWSLLSFEYWLRAFIK